MRQLKFIGILLVSTIVAYTVIMLAVIVIPYNNRPVAFITNSYYIAKGGPTYYKFAEFDKNGKYDVVVLGSSRAYRGYNPEIFADSGLVLYNLGTSAQSIRNTYFIAESYITKENTGLLIIDLFSGAFRPMQLESSADLIQNLDDTSASRDIALHTKDIRCLNMYVVRRVTESDGPSFNNAVGMVNGYLGRSDSLMPAMKKYMQYFRQSPEVTLRMGEEEIMYFDKLVALCQERGINFVLVYSPTSTFYSQANHAVFTDTLNNHISGVKYFDYSSSMGLSSVDCFYDDTHMNSTGVEQFNRPLIVDLKRAGCLNR
jgi:hypothetical protein